MAYEIDGAREEDGKNKRHYGWMMASVSHMHIGTANEIFEHSTVKKRGRIREK